MRTTRLLLPRRTAFGWIAAALLLLSLGVWKLRAAQPALNGFPDGYDAVQAAPGSHRVVFENAVVRVLEVTVPPSGKTEPMHHHRWPSFFLAWDTGGRTPHIRYHGPDGSVRDSQSIDEPVVPGHWTVQWMKPEPMHAIEAVENTTPPGTPPLLRVEIKVAGGG